METSFQDVMHAPSSPGRRRLRYAEQSLLKASCSTSLRMPRRCDATIPPLTSIQNVLIHLSVRDGNCDWTANFYFYEMRNANSEP